MSLEILDVSKQEMNKFARSEEAYREAYAIRRQVVLSFGVHLHLCTHPGTAGAPST